MPELRAGFGLAKITPSSNVPLAGYAARMGLSQGIHDDLYARALVLSEGKNALTLISVDALALDAAFVAQVRAEIGVNTGIEPAAIMIAATHTHGGPLTTELFSPEPRPLDKKYLAFLRSSIVQAVTTAWNARFPARIGFGSVPVSGIGGNRHRPDGAMDPELGVMRVTDQRGQTRAVCLNYACHPTVLGPNNLQITADFPGFAVAHVAESLGSDSFAMFLNGAAGNISVGRSPKATALGVVGPGRTFEHAEKIGRQLADLAIEILPSIEVTADHTLGFAVRSVSLKLKPLPSPKELEIVLKQANEELESVRDAGNDPAKIQEVQLKALFAALIHYEACRRAPGSLQEPVEVQCLRVGQAFFVGIPLEPFVEIGLELKRAFSDHLFPVELANGYLGYLPASGASEDQGYETVSAHFEPDSDKILISHILELRKQLLDAAPEGTHHT